MKSLIDNINEFINNSHELKNYVHEKQEDKEHDEINVIFNHMDYSYPCQEFADLLQKHHANWLGVYNGKLLVSFR